MRKLILISALAMIASLSAVADEQKVFKWVDENGVTHYGDSVPARYAEYPKEVLNDRGITVENLHGKKTEEQLAAEKAEEERRVAVRMQQRADQALIATYLSVEEILLHRVRRVELYKAQSKVTELYLSNLERRLEKLRVDAARYQPYSEDPDAPMIPDGLSADLKKTKDTIERHENNLKKFRANEKQIIARFDNDITRFKVLKGIE